MQETGSATRPNSAAAVQRPGSAHGIFRPSSAARRVLTPIQHRTNATVSVDLSAESVPTAKSLSHAAHPTLQPKAPSASGLSVPVSSILPQMTPELIQRIARDRPVPNAWPMASEANYVPSLHLRTNAGPSPSPHASLQEDTRTPSARPSSASGEYHIQSSNPDHSAAFKSKPKPKTKPTPKTESKVKPQSPPKATGTATPLQVLFETKTLNTPLHSAASIRPKSGKTKAYLLNEEQGRSLRSPSPFSNRRPASASSYSSYSRKLSQSPSRAGSPSQKLSLPRKSPTKYNRQKKSPKKNKKTKSNHHWESNNGNESEDTETEASKKAHPKHIREKADYLCCLSKCNFEEAVKVIYHFRNFGNHANKEKTSGTSNSNDKEFVSHLSYESFTQYVEETYLVDDIYFSKTMFYLLSRLDVEENLAKSPKDRNHLLEEIIDSANVTNKAGSHGIGGLPSVLYEKSESKEYDKMVGSENLKVTIEQFCAFLGKVLHGSLIELSDICFDMMDLNHKEYLSNSDAFRILMCLCEEDELCQILSKLERVFSGGDLVSKPTFLKMMRMNPELINKIRFALAVPFEESGSDFHEAEQALEDILSMNRGLNQDIKMMTYTRKGEYLMAWKDGKLVELIGEFRFDSLPDKEFGIFFLQDPELFFADSVYRKACVLDGIRHRGVAVMVGIRTADRQPDVISLVFHLSLFSALSASRWYDAHKGDLPPRRWALGLRVDQDGEWGEQREPHE